MNRFHILAITHKNNALDVVGEFHLSDDEKEARLNALKSALDLDELMYLSTCNRVEFMFVGGNVREHGFEQEFYKAFNPSWSEGGFTDIIISEFYHGDDAVKHIMNVASSVESMVVGEREIITQVRNAFDDSRKMDISGDFIRILLRKTIETAKLVYNKTAIAERPVSITSLAYRRLVELNVGKEARFLIVGAGQTCTNFTRFLQKHGYEKFNVFNRTLRHAQELANQLGGNAYELDELKNYEGGFDVLVTCTGGSKALITPAVYEKLIKDHGDRKIIVDLAVPGDVSKDVAMKEDVYYLGIKGLETIAAKNLQERKGELEKVNTIIESSCEEFIAMSKEREVELAMGVVPRKIKEIRQTAVESVFADEIQSLDENSQKILEDVISYIEKKYVSVPMKMAKEIILEEKAGTNA